MHTMHRTMRCVSTTRSRLAPIFRSDTQLQILAATYLQPDRRFSIPDLVARAKRPQPTVAREVERLTEAGLLESALHQGRRSVWAATEAPIFDELRSILLKTVGPKPVIEECLTGVAGIHHAFIYGSWARRYQGEPGAAPNDIDLLVVGSVDVDLVRARSDEASSELGRDVNATVLTDDEWEAAASGFLQQVKNGPLVELDLAS